MPLVDDPSTARYYHRADTVTTDSGRGPALVCSHSALMDQTLFRPQVEAFADDYRVVTYDSRARTDRWQGPYDLDDLVSDCRNVLKARGIESCVLLGMSMGGFMALRFALQHPDMVDGLVLGDTMADDYEQHEQDEYSRMVQTAKDVGRIPEEMLDVTASIMFGRTTIEERPELVDHWKHRWQTYPGDAVHDEVHSFIHAEGIEDRLDEIDVPTLVIHGEEDVSIAPERAEPMADGIPDARMERIDAAGHCSNLEAPAAFNEALGAFLEYVYD